MSFSLACSGTVGGLPEGSGGSGPSTGGAGVPAATGGSGPSTVATGGSATGGSATGATGRGGNAGANSGGRAGTSTGTGGNVGPGPAPSSALCPPAALVCEDFEDGKADGWTTPPTGMAVSTTHASSGTSAMSLTIPANGRGGFITFRGAPLFPLVNKTMWGRVMVWFDSAVAGHTDIIRGQAATGGNPTYNVGEQRGAYLLNYYNGSSATDCWARPRAPTPTVVALGKWMCWEWSFNAGTNNMQFFVDGTLYRAVNMTGDGCLTGNGPWIAPSDFGSVGVGATVAELSPTIMQMWFDDIAIGTADRIGCPAP